MLRGVRSQIAKNGAGTQDAITLGVMSSWSGSKHQGVIFAHGSGGSAVQTLTEPNHRSVMYNLCQHSGIVRSGDWAFQAWGNDAAVASVSEGVNSLRSDWGVTGKIAFVGVSMGGCNLLNYIVRHPEDVLCFAGILALTDLGALYDLDTAGSRADISAAYGGTLSVADRAAHSPIAFVQNLPEAPMCLWTAPDDEILPPNDHANFIDARPATEQVIINPSYGHSAPSVGQTATSVSAWVRAQSVL